MEAIHDLRVLGAVAVPVVAAAAILLCGRRRAEAITSAAAAATLALVGSLLPDVLRGVEPSARVLSLAPGIDLALRVDGLGMTFGLLSAGLWLVSSLYSFGYVRAARLESLERYFACFAASIGAALGVAFAGNVLTFLLFYEALTAATWPLVAHKESPAAAAAGRRYLAYALSGGLLLTVAAAWSWSLAGTLEFTPGGFLAQAPAGLAALFLLGCGVKAAVMPLHGWLPAAMIAPTPVSALLHAVAVVKAGVFGCLRVLGWVFGPETLRGSSVQAVLLAACAVTIVVGSMAALAQDHLKRRLAYSTIVHLSYIVLGAALLAPQAMKGAVMHLANHGVAKITLFFCAGAIYAAARVERISELAGLGRRMPWTFAAFTVGALGLIGVPGLCGFAGKLLLAKGAWDSGQGVVLAVLLGGAVLGAAYVLPILRAAYLEGPREAGGRAEAPASMVVALCVTAALVLVLGAFTTVIDVQYALADRAVAPVFAGAP
jgi:multicomponent Na+:H+ antiporter subunit D